MLVYRFSYVTRTLWERRRNLRVSFVRGTDVKLSSKQHRKRAVTKSHLDTTRTMSFIPS
jgi:hypothetical protein